MFQELAVATCMVLLTVVLHAGGLTALEAFAAHMRNASRRYSARAAALVSIVLGLFILHGLEIWLYAALYRGLGAIGDTRTAVYFSTITYGAIGYSDSGMASDWQLVAAIEGLNGVLLIGWTTAFFVTTVGRLRRR